MNNLLELVVAALEVLIALRTSRTPVQVTPALRDGLGVVRGIWLNNAPDPKPFETGEEALAWLRSVIQWDLVNVVVGSMLGKVGTAGGPLFWQGFAQAAYDAFDLAAPPKPDAREHAKVMIEIGQAQSQFQILRAQLFEDLATQTLAGFAAASAAEE